MRRMTASMALGHYALYRDGRVRLSAIRLSMVWLAIFLFVLRAFMPTGFMPDPGALCEGHLRIIYCVAAGPMPLGMAMDGHHMSDQPHAMNRDDRQQQAPGHAGTADCPFGLSGGYTYVPAVLAIWAPLLALAWHVPAPAPSSGVVAGPPVGSRAPPPRPRLTSPERRPHPAPAVRILPMQPH
jgi:hypothetical protein